MAPTLTLLQAARIAHCHYTTMRHLVIAGKIAGTQSGKSEPWIVTATREEIAAYAAEHLQHTPYAKRHEKPTKAHAKRRTQRKVNDAVQTEPRLSVLKDGGELRLAAAIEWLSLQKEKRDVLLTIAQRFSLDALRLLTQL
jgi:hypothetical protein